jgi:hypothetical protein
MSWAVEFTQDILSLVALGIGLVAGIYMQLPALQWGHVLLFVVGAGGAVGILLWFVLSVQI